MAYRCDFTIMLISLSKKLWR